ncbi:protein of unknown function [Parapedobacter luteus]|uniref:DUF4625 domain-containing protein n=1 Tax=Parapedobacter luteus TaxID=623280 RepID=A0A1T5CVY2_9SPHI|nr:DUF4625 domain-containing protein [Parapedobacter luteus]SKB63501.1 protein of unknown function [Parapedobacter luteus]
MKSITTKRIGDSVHGFLNRPTFVLLLLVVMAGCGRQEAGVSKLRIGADGNAEAFVGQSFPVEAHVAATTTISEAEINIRPVSGDGWVFNGPFSEGIAGKKDATFAARIDVPADTEPGNYTLTLRVIDADGSVSESTGDFRIGIDSTVPIAGDLDVGINAAGNDLHLETELTVPGKIDQVTVEIKGDAWSDEVTFAGDRLVGQLAHHFHEHIAVAEAPKGDYRVILTVADQRGRRAQAEGTFTKK